MKVCLKFSNLNIPLLEVKISRAIFLNLQQLFFLILIKLLISLYLFAIKSIKHVLINYQTYYTIQLEYILHNEIMRHELLPYNVIIKLFCNESLQ